LVGDLLGVLAAGLGGAALAEVFFATAFFVVFFVVAFLLAALAFDAAVVPVTVFFAGARLLATVVFFASAALALPARTFLEAGALDLVAAFFAGGLEALLVKETALGFVLVDLERGLVEADFKVEAGLEGLFSLDDVSAGLDLGANLTLPEGPLGRKKTPFSAPTLMAFASWVV